MKITLHHECSTLPDTEAEIHFGANLSRRSLLNVSDETCNTGKTVSSVFSPFLGYNLNLACTGKVGLSSPSLKGLKIAMHASGQKTDLNQIFRRKKVLKLKIFNF